jgi:hypothetical protein
MKDAQSLGEYEAGSALSRASGQIRRRGAPTLPEGPSRPMITANPGHLYKRPSAGTSGFCMALLSGLALLQMLCRCPRQVRADSRADASGPQRRANKPTPPRSTGRVGWVC